MTPVTYSEVELSKKDKGLGNEDLLGEVGSKLEVYTEEHVKLLGNTERSWTFFVDGYDSNGSRIYDSIKGKTCHQCRLDCLNVIILDLNVELVNQGNSFIYMDGCCLPMK